MKMLLKTLQLTVRSIRSSVSRLQSVDTLIKTQRYSDWAHRRPIAAINEEIVLDEAEEAPKPRKYINDSEEYQPLRTRPRRMQRYKKKPEPVIKSDGTYLQDGSPNFTKLADNDRTLMKLMMTVKSRKMRERSNQILLEGHRLISDAIKAGLKLETIISSRTVDVMKLSLPENGITLYKVPYKTIQLWSSLTTTPGIIGIFEVPESLQKTLTKDVIPLTIICDNVREPGNMGSILRAAAGVGCEQVILTKGCVDLWEPKVLRSAAGGHFRISISKSLEWDDIKSMINPAAKIFAADNNVTSYTEELSNTPVAEKSSDSNNDGETAPSLSMSNATLFQPEPFSKMRKVDTKELASHLPVIPYYSVDFTTNEIVLIVGGETEGLSYETIQFLRESQGVRLNVPLINEVESLNTGMALGIIAFEVRRQFAIKRDTPVQ